MKKAIWIFAAGFLFVTAGLVTLAAWVTVQQCEDIVDSNERLRERLDEDMETITMEECLGIEAASGSENPSGSPGASPPGGGLQNGRLPFSMLERVSSHGDYECLVASFNGAADAWRQLVIAAQADGIDIEGGWCYRTYEAQAEAWNSRRCFVPGNCDGDPYPPTAPPGKSNHGWGLAIDAWNAWDTILSCSDPEFFWMQLNAPRFGWEHPGWARCGRGSQEPWHWEYVG